MEQLLQTVLKEDGDTSKSDFFKILYSCLEDDSFQDEFHACMKKYLFHVLRQSKLKSLTEPREAIMCHSVSPKVQAMNLLIADYLLRQDFLYTLSVFSSEDPNLKNLKSFSHYINCLAHKKSTEFVHKNMPEPPKLISKDIRHILECLGLSAHSEESIEARQMYMDWEDGDPLILCVLSSLVSTVQNITRCTRCKTAYDTQRSQMFDSQVSQFFENQRSQPFDNQRFQNPENQRSQHFDNQRFQNPENQRSQHFDNQRFQNPKNQGSHIPHNQKFQTNQNQESPELNTCQKEMGQLLCSYGLDKSEVNELIQNLTLIINRQLEESKVLSSQLERKENLLREQEEILNENLEEAERHLLVQKQSLERELESKQIKLQEETTMLSTKKANIREAVNILQKQKDLLTAKEKEFKTKMKSLEQQGIRLEAREKDVQEGLFKLNKRKEDFYEQRAKLCSAKKSVNVNQTCDRSNMKVKHVNVESRNELLDTIDNENKEEEANGIRIDSKQLMALLKILETQKEAMCKILEEKHGGACNQNKNEAMQGDYKHKPNKLTEYDLHPYKPSRNTSEKVSCRNTRALVCENVSCTTCRNTRALVCANVSCTTCRNTRALVCANVSCTSQMSTKPQGLQDSYRVNDENTICDRCGSEVTLKFHINGKQCHQTSKNHGVNSQECHENTQTDQNSAEYQNSQTHRLDLHKDLQDSAKLQAQMNELMARFENFSTSLSPSLTPSKAERNANMIQHIDQSDSNCHSATETPNNARTATHFGALYRSHGPMEPSETYSKDKARLHHSQNTTNESSIQIRRNCPEISDFNDQHSLETRRIEPNQFPHKNDREDRQQLRLVPKLNNVPRLSNDINERRHARSEYIPRSNNWWKHNFPNDLNADPVDMLNKTLLNADPVDMSRKTLLNADSVDLSRKTLLNADPVDMSRKTLERISSELSALDESFENYRDNIRKANNTKSLQDLDHVRKLLSNESARQPADTMHRSFQTLASRFHSPRSPLHIQTHAMSQFSPLQTPSTLTHLPTRRISSLTGFPPGSQRPTNYFTAKPSFWQQYLKTYHPPPDKKATWQEQFQAFASQVERDREVNEDANEQNGDESNGHGDEVETNVNKSNRNNISKDQTNKESKTNNAETNDSSIGYEETVDHMTARGGGFGQVNGTSKTNLIVESIHSSNNRNQQPGGGEKQIFQAKNIEDDINGKDLIINNQSHISREKLASNKPRLLRNFSVEEDTIDEQSLSNRKDDGNKENLTDERAVCDIQTIDDSEREEVMCTGGKSGQVKDNIENDGDFRGKDTGITDEEIRDKFDKTLQESEENAVDKISKDKPLETKDSAVVEYNTRGSLLFQLQDSDESL